MMAMGSRLAMGEEEEEEEEAAMMVHSVSIPGYSTLQPRDKMKPRYASVIYLFVERAFAVVMAVLARHGNCKGPELSTNQVCMHREEQRFFVCLSHCVPFRGWKAHSTQEDRTRRSQIIGIQESGVLWSKKPP